MKAVKKNKTGTVTQIWTSRSEQGFAYRQHGLKDQIWLDFEGLGLPVKLRKEKKKGPAETDVD